jgi:hypothetical protein
MTTVSSSGSPCLSPIRYALDTSQINQNQSTNIEENIIPIPTEEIQANQISLPIDDTSLKVSTIGFIIRKAFDRNKLIVKEVDF